MTTDDMRKLPQWKDIKEAIDKAVITYREIFPLSFIELVDKKTKFVIVVDGNDEMEICVEKFQ